MNSGPEDALRAIGRVRSVNPSRREVRIDYDAPARVLAEDTTWLWFDDASGRRCRCKVTAVTTDGLVVLAQGVTRDTVAGLRGTTVRAESVACHARFWPLADELVGMRVMAADGAPCGVVVGVLEGPAHDVVRVERTDGSRFLLPVVEPAVVGADPQTRMLTVASDLAAYAVDEP